MSELLHTYKDWKGMQIQDLVMPDLRARMALEIAKTCGMSTAVEDDEDSTGRQKLRLLSPEEVALRAVNIAGDMYDEFVARGWLGTLPIIEDVKDE